MSTQTRKSKAVRRHYSPSAQVVIHDRAGLYVAVVAIALAAVCIGLLALLPAYIGARIDAGKSQAEQTARAAEVNARLALDRADKMAAALEARGLIKLENH